MNSPSRRDRTRPAELLGLSGVIAAFVGLVAFMATRDLIIALVGLGIAFIASVVTIAMLVLSTKPGGLEQQELDEHDDPGAGPRGH